MQLVEYRQAHDSHIRNPPNNGVLGKRKRKEICWLFTDEWCFSCVNWADAWFGGDAWFDVGANCLVSYASC